MTEHDHLLDSAETALQCCVEAVMHLREIQETRHPYNGRAASLAVTHVEDAQYRILDIITNLRAESAPAIDEKPIGQ